MIESFRHKGLQLLFDEDDGRKVTANQIARLKLIMFALDSAKTIDDINQPNFHLHALQGNRRGVWSVTVRANWRVTFEFREGKAYNVNLEDYH